MIGLPAAELDPGPGPLTPARTTRLLVVAVSVVAVQVYGLDAVRLPVLDRLDLPLAVAVGLILARPAQSTAIGLIVGLTVDAFGHRLFGLHCLAYATLGPVLRAWPPGVGRRGRGAGPAATMALVASSVVVVGQSLADRAGPPPGELVARLIVVPLSVAVLAGPVARLAGRGRTGRSWSGLGPVRSGPDR